MHRNVDCHAHVIAPDRFPYLDGPGYRPRPDEGGDAAMFQGVLEENNVTHALLVQPSCYGTDNACMLDAIARSQGRYMEIAVVEMDSPHEALLSLKRREVVGVRPRARGVLERGAVGLAGVLHRGEHRQPVLGEERAAGLGPVPNDEGGIKTASFAVRGPYAYGYLRPEIGVHRLVRISPFDAQKRRHTSFAAVDAVPEFDDEIEIEIAEKDLRIETYRSGGAGGQHVNKTESAVRITHMPTGVVAACQNERSQHRNRAMAIKMLKGKLFRLQEMERDAELKKLYGEKGEIAFGSQIRNYVLQPYQLVKDVRSGHESGNVDAVLDGAIDPFIEAYLRGRMGKGK